MALLTVSELREHLETDLSDEALQRILAAEEAEIVRRYGPTTTQAETLETGEAKVLVLARPATSITSAVETESDYITQTTLDASDYRLYPDGRLERLPTGSHARSNWAPLLSVTYVPVDVSAQRRLVLVQLGMLAAKYTAMKSESVGGGDYAGTALDYAVERESLLRSLAGRKLWVV